MFFFLERLDSWIKFELDHLFFGISSNENSFKLRKDFLEKLKNFIEKTNELPFSIQPFLTSFLPIWNGYDFKEEILFFIEYLTAQEYEKISNEIFKIIEKRFFLFSDLVQSEVIISYGKLLRRWFVCFFLFFNYFSVFVTYFFIVG